MGNKTAYKEERQTEKKKKWTREKDQNRFAKKKGGVQILACAHEQKTKKVFKYVWLVGKLPFFCCKTNFKPFSS